jgi:excisionase family DNA binding protein
MTRSQTPHDPVDPFLTTRKAALLLGVTMRSVQNYVERGELHSGRTPGGHRRIRMSDVHALAKKMGIEPATPMKERPDFIAGYDAGMVDGKRCAQRDAHPELTRLRAELADYKRRAEASAGFLAEAEAVCSANAVDIRQLRAEVERLKSTPPDQREDLHCAVSDLTRECNQLRAEVERLQAQLDVANLAGVAV